MNSTTVGLLATIGSYAILGGLIIQVVTNFRERRSGFTLPLALAITYTYGCWAAYGWMKPDYFLAASQTPGFILAVILTYQTVRYRRA